MPFVCYNLISVSLRSRSLLHTTLCYHTLVTTPNPKQKCLLRSSVRSNETKSVLRLVSLYVVVVLVFLRHNPCCLCSYDTNLEYSSFYVYVLSSQQRPLRSRPASYILHFGLASFILLCIFFLKPVFTKPSTLASTYLSTSRVVTLVPHKFSPTNPFGVHVRFLLSVIKTYQNLPLPQKFPSCFVVANDYNKTPTNLIWCPCWS